MIMKIIRNVLGTIIIALDAIIPVKKIKRSKDDQEAVNEAAKKLELYQFKGCPFCLKVRRHARKLNIPLATKDAQNNQALKSELKDEGGSSKVPCLKIQNEQGVQWLYNSKVIISYLDELINVRKLQVH